MTAHYNMSDPSEDGMIQRLVDSKYWYTVSIPTLRERTADKKLLMVGSLHGTGRLRLDYESNIDNHAFFQRSLAFKNPVLDQPADHIRDLMGGPNGYAGVHARVGDGNFRRNSVNSMKQTYTNLLKRLGVKQHIIKDLATKGYEEASKMQAQQEKDSHSRKKMHKRSLHQQVKQSSDPTHSPWLPAADDTEDETRFSEVHLSNQLGRRQIATLLQPVQSREDMSLSSQMVCRGELHTNPDMQLLNNPVYIATDSRSPLDEPALQYFWNTLPCAFILSDFDRSGPQNTGEPVHELKVMQSAVNVNDDVKLGRLFLPFMEAMVAAKAVVTAGTAGSTFSYVT